MTLNSSKKKKKTKRKKNQKKKVLENEMQTSLMGWMPCAAVGSSVPSGCRL
jgi:hypothetical protein